MCREVFYKGWKKKLILVLFLPFLFFSCATQQQFNSLDSRVNSIEYRLYQLDKQLSKDMAKNLNSNIKPLRQNIADMQADMDSIRSDISSVRGYSEENRMMLKKIVESDISKVDQISQQLDQLSQRVSKIEGQMKQIKDYLGLTEESISERNRQLIPSKATSKEDIYASAFSLYKKGLYEEAILGFKDFLKRYPKSKLSDNAWFWIGECYMGMGKYEKAILAYHEVTKRYPKGNKVPSAMLRQAQAFQRIGDKTSAKLLLRRLIKKFPRSNEARIAKKVLRKLR